MKRLSFRLRIALLSATLAGSALVGFGTATWIQIYKAKISRLDAGLLNEFVHIPQLRQYMDTLREQNREHQPINPDCPSEPLETPSNMAIALLVRDASSNLLCQTKLVSADQELKQRMMQEIQLAPLPTEKPLLDKLPFAPSPPKPPLDSPSAGSSSIDSPPPSQPPFPPRPKSLRKSFSPMPPFPQFVPGETKTGTWRIGAMNFSDFQIAIAVNIQPLKQEMATIRNIFAISIPGVLLLIAGGAWFLAGSALRPIRQLTNVIQRVTVQGLDQRIPVGTTDVEFVELIQVFNQMLERLERSFTQASRFSADAAHELKTPLTILQGELERSLQQVEPGSDVQQRLGNLLDEVHRLSGIMRKLLLLSLADAGHLSLYLVEVDMTALLAEMVDDVELLAPHLTLKTDIAEPLRVRGDRDLLNQVLQNLLSNAIKYNLANGWIEIRANSDGTRVRVTVTNASNDIPTADRDRIFDRFHRGDPARTRKVEGLGLGLSLAREIARAHGGNLTLDTTPTGQTAFTLTL